MDSEVDSGTRSAATLLLSRVLLLVWAAATFARLPLSPSTRFFYYSGSSITRPSLSPALPPASLGLSLGPSLDPSLGGPRRGPRPRESPSANRWRARAVPIRVAFGAGLPR